jgi:hypothetical protein
MANLRIILVDKIYKKMKKAIKRHNDENVQRITVREFVSSAIAEKLEKD